MGATIAAIVEVGADAVTLSDIANRAGVSRPTAYSMVGSVSGAFAEVWLSHGAAWLDRILMDEGDDDGSTDLPSAAVTALTDLVLIAGREPEVAEVLRSDLDRVWAAAVADGESALLRLTWLLATAIGVEASRGVSQNLELGALALGLIRSMPPSVRRIVDLEGDVPPVGIPADSPRPTVLNPDEITASLIDAAITVAASAGVAHASMLRICRVAGVTTGAGRPRFPSVEELILAGFDYEIGDVVDENIFAITTVSGGGTFMDLYGEFMRRGLSPQRTRWRQFRQEMHLSARVNDSIADALRASITASERHLGAAITAPSIGLSEVVANAALGVNQVLSVGIPALYRIGLPVDTLDHRVPLRWVYRSMISEI